MRRNNSRNASQITINLMFTLYSIICLGTLLLILSGSFSTESDLSTIGFQFLPKRFTLNAYRFIFGNGTEVLKAYYYSILSTVVGTTTGVIVMAALAYPISRKDFKYKRGITFYVYFTMLFNGGMVPLYLVYTQLINIKNSWLALVIPNMIGGFHILLMRTFMSQNIPDEVIASAEIDGASTYRIFFSMILPLSTPIIVTVALLTGIAYWNDQFRNMLLINDNSVKNLQFLLYLMVQQIQNINLNPEVVRSLNGEIPDLTARMAMAIIVVGPLAMLFPLLSKYFVKGLVAGSVKG